MSETKLFVSNQVPKEYTKEGFEALEFSEVRSGLVEVGKRIPFYSCYINSISTSYRDALARLGSDNP